MWSVYIYTFLLNLGYMSCRLKDVGEVTNFSLHIDYMVANFHRNSKLIHGGTTATNVDAPYNIIFLNFQGLCGGVIISNAIVLTCAHCLDSNKNLPDMRIFAGSRYIFDPAADVYKVWEFIIHEEYDVPIRFSNDAALLIIHGQFKYKPSVQKALLVNHRKWMADGIVFKVTGFEEIIHGDNSSRNLRSVNLRYVHFQQCKAQTRTILSPDMFCLFGDGEQASCRGDSGSPAMVHKYVVGLASHDVQCEENPGIYINVYYLRPWIELSSNKLYYKYCYHHGSIPGDY